MPADPRIHIVTAEEYARQREAEEAKRLRPRTADELRKIAADALKLATQWRTRIEREERPGGRAGSATWPTTKAILVEVAEGYERDAARALAEAAEIQTKS